MSSSGSEGGTDSPGVGAATGCCPVQASHCQKSKQADQERERKETPDDFAPQKSFESNIT